jgi:hypothetical protein
MSELDVKKILTHYKQQVVDEGEIILYLEGVRDFLNKKRNTQEGGGFKELLVGLLATFSLFDSTNAVLVGTHDVPQNLVHLAQAYVQGGPEARALAGQIGDAFNAIKTTWTLEDYLGGLKKAQEVNPDVIQNLAEQDPSLLAEIVAGTMSFVKYAGPPFAALGGCYLTNDAMYSIGKDGFNVSSSDSWKNLGQAGLGFAFTTGGLTVSGTQLGIAKVGVAAGFVSSVACGMYGYNVGYSHRTQDAKVVSVPGGSLGKSGPNKGGGSKLENLVNEIIDEQTAYSIQTLFFMDMLKNKSEFVSPETIVKSIFLINLSIFAQIEPNCVQILQNFLQSVLEFKTQERMAITKNNIIKKQLALTNNSIIKKPLALINNNENPLPTYVTAEGGRKRKSKTRKHKRRQT